MKTTHAIYHGDDAQAIIDTFGQAWCRGENIIVHAGLAEYDFFGFLCMAGTSRGEPAEWIARFILTRRALKRPYLGASTHLVRRYAKRLAVRMDDARKIVRTALHSLEDSGAWR